MPTEPSPSGGKSKRGRNIAVALIALVIAGGAGWLGWNQFFKSGKAGKPDEPGSPKPKPEVVTEEDSPIGPALTKYLRTARMSDPKVRAAVVAKVKAREVAIRKATEAKAKQLGIPVKLKGPDGTFSELQGFEGGRPIYYTLYNENAATFSGARKLQEKKGEAPKEGPVLKPGTSKDKYVYNLTGRGVIVGVWDGGGALLKHQELKLDAASELKKDAQAYHVKINDGAEQTSGNATHATHVTGTVTAAGIDPKAKGMAPFARVHSYDWNSDFSEMLAAGASAATETDKISISSHSYGQSLGYHLSEDGTRWDWWTENGTSATSTESGFGRYEAQAAQMDTLSYSLPYLTSFYAAGNDRNNNPNANDPVNFARSYNSETMPKGDGKYRNGFDTIGGKNLAKNVITVGAVDKDGKMSDFSSWGPTDDGRIKPDIVADGVQLYSCNNKPLGNPSGKEYEEMGGTSMATPSASGSSALLVELYRKLFKDKTTHKALFMPSSMLKALLIHTAGDLGNPGPDYTYGWGKIDVKKAADVIVTHARATLPEFAYPGQKLESPKMIQGTITKKAPTFTHVFEWDGENEIRATLCWTDPAGPAQTDGDSRTPVLVNDLDLLITGPSGQKHEAYVMPFTVQSKDPKENWSVDNMSKNAIHGRNRIDNVEQVYDIAKPKLDGAGLYTVTVKLHGALALANGESKKIEEQRFSLVVTGGKKAPPDKQPKTPVATSTSSKGGVPPAKQPDPGKKITSKPGKTKPPSVAKQPTGSKTPADKKVTTETAPPTDGTTKVKPPTITKNPPVVVNPPPRLNPTKKDPNPPRVNKPPREPGVKPKPEPPDDTTTEPPDDTTTEPPDDTTTEPPDDTTTEPPDDTTTEPPDDESGTTPGEICPICGEDPCVCPDEDTPAPDDTATEPPDDTTTEPPDDTTTEPPDDESGTTPGEICPTCGQDPCVCPDEDAPTPEDTDDTATEPPDEGEGSENNDDPDAPNYQPPTDESVETPP